VKILWRGMGKFSVGLLSFSSWFHIIFILVAIIFILVSYHFHLGFISFSSCYLVSSHMSIPVYNSLYVYVTVSMLSCMYVPILLNPFPPLSLPSGKYGYSSILHGWGKCRNFFSIICRGKKRGITRVCCL